MQAQGNLPHDMSDSVVCGLAKGADGKRGRVMTTKEAIYLLRNTAWLAPSLEPIDEAIDMACEALCKTENSSEKPNNCETQTIRCPKCGRTDYIREFGKDFSVTAEEAGFKYKYINCNTYIEPQTEVKIEPSWVGETYGHFKDEPQTEKLPLHEAFEMAVDECKRKHKGCENCDMDCVWRDEQSKGVSDD